MIALYYLSGCTGVYLIELRTGLKKAITIEKRSIERILNLYPEEELLMRKTFQETYDDGYITFSKLKKECETICIPWQLFFLDYKKLNDQLTHVERKRDFKVTGKYVTKRKGEGDISSKRIIDRLIRLQNFILKEGDFSKNKFCGKLIGLSDKQAAKALVYTYLKFDRTRLWERKNIPKALERYIELVENLNINVSSGVLKNKILPEILSARNIYKNTSGICIHDQCVPMIFLPSETNQNEPDARQIYTLIFLLVCIGLNEFDVFIDEKLKAKKIKSNPKQRKINRIVSEFFIPEFETNKFKNKEITLEFCSDCCYKYKVSFIALLTIFKNRQVISKEQYDEFYPDDYDKNKKSPIARTPAVHKSVKKFTGKLGYDTISRSLAAGTLPQTQAQYLIFGTINKKNFHKFRQELNL